MIYRKLIYLIITLSLVLVNQTFAQQRTNPKNQSEELGTVHWHRNYEEAVAIAKKEKKDLVILFQEVPGCSTCRNYGHNVLSHPLMVEALENTFTPLAIFNNKNGTDKKILEKFKEPSWNNPVVRIIDPNGKNIVQRVSNDYSALTLCKKLKEALRLRNTSIPLYLELLEQELSALNSNEMSEAYFKMHCFWIGEKELGKLDGVLDVESGFMNHNEVVKVKYNPSSISNSELISYAKKQGFKFVNNLTNYKIAVNEVHYYLLHSDYKYLPLSELQKTKINSALGSNQKAELYLSPKQLKWLHFLKQNKAKGFHSKMNQKIEDAWMLMELSYAKISKK